MYRGLTQASDSPVTGTAAWLASACAILSKDCYFAPILNDTDALQFALAISPDAPRALAQFDDPQRCAAYIAEREAAAPGSLTVVAYRKPEMQRLLCTALGEIDADQVVILGTGCDTLALRLARLGIAPRIFEIDRPAVIDFRETVKVRIPLDLGHVRGIGVDFEHEDFGERLLANGYDPAARTVLFAEGLLGYLAPDAIDAIFHFIKKSAAGGSRFVFSFTENRTPAAVDRVPGSAALEMQGEAPSFDLPPAEASAFVEARGMQLITLLTAGDLKRIHDARHQGRVHVLPFLHLAVATT